MSFSLLLEFNDFSLPTPLNYQPLALVLPGDVNLERKSFSSAPEFFGKIGYSHCCIKILNFKIFDLVNFFFFFLSKLQPILKYSIPGLPSFCSPLCLDIGIGLSG